MVICELVMEGQPVNDQSPQHQCRLGRRCKDRVPHPDGELVGTGVERPDSLCAACEEAAFDDIRQLGNDYRALAAAVHEPRGRIDGPKIKRTADRAIPLPLDVITLMDSIDDEVLRWTLRITRGDPLPMSPAARVERCVAILCANTGTLVDMPRARVTVWLPSPQGGDVDGVAEFDGVDAVLRLAALHQRARTTLGLTEPMSEKLRDLCHVCGCEALIANVAAAADTVIKCRNCGNCWSQEEFARLNSVLVA